MPDAIEAPPAPSPNQTPPAPPPQTPPSKPNISDMFDQDFGGKKIETPPNKDATPPADPPKDAPKDQPKPDDKLSKLGMDDDVLKKQPKDAPKEPADEPEGRPRGREPKWYHDTLEKRTAEFKAETARLQAELDKAKAPTNQKELEVYQAKVAAIEKRNEELQRKVEELDYLQSDDYKNKYEKPRVEAIKAAVDRIGSFKINNEDGTTRAATKEDFLKILRAPDSEADELAEKFGKSAPRIIQMRESILERIRAEESAVANASTEIESRKTKQAEEQTRMVQELTQTYNTRFTSRLEALSESPLEGWETPKDAVEQGKLLAATAFMNPDNLDPKQLAAVQSEVAARAAAWKGTAMLAQHLMSENEALKAKLAAYEGSAPKPGGGSAGGQPQQKFKTVADMFDADMNSR